MMELTPTTDRQVVFLSSPAAEQLLVTCHRGNSSHNKVSVSTTTLIAASSVGVVDRRLFFDSTTVEFCRISSSSRYQYPYRYQRLVSSAQSMMTRRTLREEEDDEEDDIIDAVPWAVGEPFDGIWLPHTIDISVCQLEPLSLSARRFGTA
jgi:hypothetical protein